MQWRQHEHGRLNQEAQLLSTEQATAQPCCSADCPADKQPEEEGTAAHKVLNVLLCMVTAAIIAMIPRASADAVIHDCMHSFVAVDSSVRQHMFSTKC